MISTVKLPESIIYHFCISEQVFIILYLSSYILEWQLLILNVALVYIISIQKMIAFSPTSPCWLQMFWRWIIVRPSANTGWLKCILASRISYYVTRISRPIHFKLCWKRDRKVSKPVDFSRFGRVCILTTKRRMSASDKNICSPLTMLYVQEIARKTVDHLRHWMQLAYIVVKLSWLI